VRVCAPIPELLPADIVLSRSWSRTSRLIRAFQLLQGKGLDNEARVSHVALALGDLNSTPEVVESLWRVTRTPLERYQGQEIVIWRNVRLSDVERRQVAAKALELTGDWYAPLKLPLYALDGLCSTTWFSRTLGVLPYKTCGNLVAWAYDWGWPRRLQHNPYTFGLPSRAVTPDVIDDRCRYGEDWIEVYNSLHVACKCGLSRRRP